MKTLIGFVLVVLIALAGVYLFFPATQETKAAIAIAVNARTANRFLATDSLWKKCQPQKSGSSTATFSLVQVTYEAIGLTANVGSKVYPNNLLILPFAKDSAILSWKIKINGGNLPWERIKLLSQKNLLEADQVKSLLCIKSQLEKNTMLYGANINSGLMTDSVLITTTFFTKKYPTITEIYDQINLLETYAKAQKSIATNAPMLFVHENEDLSGYKIQVALPINKSLNNTNEIYTKRMVLGNNLNTTIIGPQTHINKGLTAVQNFVNDNQFTMPAIAYQSLITNRKNEPDSNKWITKLVFPVY